MVKGDKKPKILYSGNQKTNTKTNTKTNKNKNILFFNTMKRNNKLCRSQFVSSQRLKKHLSKLNHQKYREIIIKIYKIYAHKVICSKPQKFVHKEGDYIINKFDVLDILPNNSIVNKLKSKSRQHITRKDIDLLLEDPNMAANNLILSRFSNMDIIMDLIKNEYMKYSIKYEILLPDGKRTNYKVHLYSAEKDVTIVSMVEYSTNIIKRVLFMNYLLNNNNLPSRIDIYLTKFKKIIDYSENSTISSDSVNSAVTDGQDIVIFREEEALKCLMHELIHFHRLDKKLYNFSLDNMEVNILMRRLKISHNIDLDYNHRLTEAYTECLASIFSIIVSTADTVIGISKQGIDNRKGCGKMIQDTQMTQIIKSLEYEITFSFLQISKILRYFKYDSFEELLRLAPKIIRQPLRQSTDLFAYYILKTYLMLNIFDLLDEVIDLDPISRLGSIDTIGYVEESIEKILNLNTEESKIIIYGVNKYIKRNKVNKGTKKTNLRMSCSD